MTYNFNVVLTQKYGVPAIKVCYIKSSLHTGLPTVQLYGKADWEQDYRVTVEEGCLRYYAAEIDELGQ